MSIAQLDLDPQPDRPIRRSTKPSVEIESIGFNKQHRSKFEYYILIRVKELGKSWQYNFSATLRRRFGKFKLLYIIPISISPKEYHDETHACVIAALEHLVSDLNNWI